MIIDAVIPLLLEHGRSVTSKQIAEAAGIAEGTVFRAFGDKDTLIAAAIATYLDPEPLRDSLRAVDPQLPLENKIRAIVYLMRERFEGMFRMMVAVGGERPPTPQARQEFATIIAEVLGPDAASLNWPPDRVAHVVRLISFASALPRLNDDIAFSVDDLARIILTGIAGRLPEAIERAPSARASATTASTPTTAVTT